MTQSTSLYQLNFEFLFPEMHLLIIQPVKITEQKH